MRISAFRLSFYAGKAVRSTSVALRSDVSNSAQIPQTPFEEYETKVKTQVCTQETMLEVYAQLYCSGSSEWVYFAWVKRKDKME
jgi:hypothetical protein